MAYPQNMHFRSARPGELALLEQIRARAAQSARGGPFAPGGLRLGIGDDCALLRIGPGQDLAVTTDLAIDGRHFRLAWHSPESIGHRTLARGLSDLAAMGARPVAAFLSLGLPGALVSDFQGISSKTGKKIQKETWVARFMDGFFALAHEFQTPLAGGDLAESPLAVADIVLTGAVRRGKALLRSGARPGDLLYVTGTLGGAAAALARLAQWAETQSRTRARRTSSPPRIPAKLQPLLAPHLFPQPRVAQGLWLARRGLASAAIDLSDGLSTDLAHLCEESARRRRSRCGRIADSSGRNPRTGSPWRRRLRTAVRRSAGAHACRAASRASPSRASAASCARGKAGRRSRSSICETGCAIARKARSRSGLEGGSTFAERMRAELAELAESVELEELSI